MPHLIAPSFFQTLQNNKGFIHIKICFAEGCFKQANKLGMIKWQRIQHLSQNLSRTILGQLQMQSRWAALTTGGSTLGRVDQSGATVNRCSSQLGTSVTRSITFLEYHGSAKGFGKILKVPKLVAMREKYGRPSIEKI